MAAPGDKGSDLYKNLLNKGVSAQDIDKVQKNLREKGYGSEEAMRRSRSLLGRMRAQKELEERRRDKSAEAPEPREGKPPRPRPEPAVRKAQTPKLRAADWMAPISPALRRRINRWARRNGYRITGISERWDDFLSLFGGNRKDYASRDFIRLLSRRTGWQGANPYGLSFLDALDALTHSSRMLLGGERGARKLSEKERARQIEEDVRKSLRVREPFALEFLSVFAEPQPMLRRSLEFLELDGKAGRRVEIASLARVVKDGYRLILVTQGVEAEKMDGLFSTVRDVNLVHDGSPHAMHELAEAEALFRATFQTLIRFGQEMYPALLKMTGGFWEPRDDDPVKRRRILEFLELSEAQLLTYAGYQKRQKEAREAAVREKEQKEIEQLEQEKTEGFTARFDGILEALARLFPDSGIERMEQGVYLLPYFVNRVFVRSPIFQGRLVALEKVARGDAFALVLVLHMILDDLLSSLDPYALEALVGRELESLGRDHVSKELVDLRDGWGKAYGAIFDPYLEMLHEYARGAEGDEKYARDFRAGRRARSIEERLNQLKNHTVRGWGHVISEVVAYDGPELYELARRLDELLSAVGGVISPDKAKAGDAVAVRALEELKKAKILDFPARSNTSSLEFKPVVRQIRRYLEARWKSSVERMPQLSQAFFLDVLRGAAGLYAYLLNDPGSFLSHADHAMQTAAEQERALWNREKQERGRESLMKVQERIQEDLKGQYTDALTGLRNKNWLLAEASRRLEDLAAHGKAMTVLMMDIDHFKWVNDGLGHAKGDEVLAAAAGLLRDAIREADQAVRYGGEELLVLVPQDLHAGILLAERLRHAQEQALESAEVYAGVHGIGKERGEPCGTFSIGVAAYGDSKDLQEAMERADRALYAAKRQRNRVCFFDPKKRAAEYPFSTYQEYQERASPADTQPPKKP